MPARIWNRAFVVETDAQVRGRMQRAGGPVETSVHITVIEGQRLCGRGSKGNGREIVGNGCVGREKISDLAIGYHCCLKTKSDKACFALHHHISNLWKFKNYQEASTVKTMEQKTYLQAK